MVAEHGKNSRLTVKRGKNALGVSFFKSTLGYGILRRVPDREGRDASPPPKAGKKRHLHTTKKTERGGRGRLQSGEREYIEGRRPLGEHENLFHGGVGKGERVLRRISF